MMTKLLLPALMLAACGDNLQPSDDVKSGTEVGSDAQDGETPARAIDASIFIFAPSCDAAVAQFETEVRYVDDGSLVTDLSCLWTFDDGTTSTECIGEHTFATGGFHDFVLDVTDLTTGATDRATQNRFIDPVIDANLEVTGGDLTISWVATTNVGEVRVFVEPSEFITTDDPNYFLKRTNTITVSRAGTYTVTMFVEDERSVGPICNEQIVKQVEVFCTGNHTH